MENKSFKLKSANKLSSESTSSKSKCKSFLTSILSPSVSKRKSKKKSEKSIQSNSTRNSDKNIPRIELDQESVESLYSTIQGVESIIHESINSSPKSTVTEAKVEHQSSAKSHDEPVYAIVKKEDKFLREKLKELTIENRQLKKEVEDLLINEKRKEETAHAKMQLKITQFEAETLQEIKSLKERIHILLKEKDCLNNQIDVLHDELKKTRLQCDALEREKKTMVASSHHNKIVEELKKVFKEATESRNEDFNELKQQCDILEENKTILSSQVQELNTKLNASLVKNENTYEENQKFFQENSDLKKQIEEFKQMEIETQKLLLPLLKMTEDLSMERDVLQNKISFQEYQQKELHTAVVDHSLVIGRLQEHLSNLNTEKIQEILPVKSRFNEAENINLLRQMDIMRNKLREQNTVLSEMENEKRKLELQLENVMESFFDKTVIYNS